MGLTESAPLSRMRIARRFDVPYRVIEKACLSDPVLHPLVAFQIRNAAITEGMQLDGKRIPLARIAVQHPLQEDTEESLRYYKWQAEGESCDALLIPFGSRTSAAEQLSYLQGLQKEPFDGIILFHSELTQKDLRKIPKRVPIVFVDPVYRIPEGDNQRVFLTDYAAGIEDAISAFERGGHTKIAFVSEALVEESTVMEEAFTAVMHERGVEEPDILSDSRELDTPPSYLESGYTIGKYVFAPSEAPTPTAFICARTSLAVGLLRAAHESKRKFPGDISVVGMGNKEFAYYYPQQSIPILSLEERDFTREACQAILLILSQGSLGDPTPRPQTQTHLNVHTGEAFELMSKWM